MHAAKISMPILCLAILSLALICSAVPIDSVHRPVYNTWGIPGNNVQVDRSHDAKGIGVDWELIVDADINGDDDDGSDSNLDVDGHDDYD